ncbi:MAG: 4-hydroxy-3-methylbut-2-en-1-yl diphosphate synthase [Zetaproteobacteria bacterium CG_4_9_14_3_um_filter_49_83]|nr:MAG: 4-hydroxy-3-methylbut-2-en-1-yl diphosphate synthase [Zetaproteobacteria bacterium CG1_02_49_23]PIQ30105.1 MAG: 4-hydroxy-3-methylbut-2-en-1-yl diphosphate synthase [Zetaproteobacteria bacterium CG17_big_fil_post_rev_8_21_14_2_50_50_13]PIV31525.1 MAG: 4-hydroxy-3-methylbut-2-en-1-yl diphosphate synthase [Zetaproteobacteria bacterium CG02_land_8_20_14_3_00_50_9]PIY55947.1 MAG: 4-hydroxy-3-methylbut-2-en-1-yl diphosphate synthase [Zetaproteobacteria bacterium CG_4_10_14_0_8_um_filter_49_80
MRDAIVKNRRKTRSVQVGRVQVGGDAPIAVQSMTNTKTTDIDATVAQVQRLQQAGADIVRISVPDPESAAAMPEILRQTDVPIIADIHFSYKMALLSLEAGVHGLRLNPGNIGTRDRVERVVKAAKERGVSIRIGVNAGSLEKEFEEKYGEPCADAMVDSALSHIRILEEMDFFDIKVSLKASNIPMTVSAYRKLAEKVDYPLHLGITESGSKFGGTVKSSMGLALMLVDGIGDTIRVSLAAEPEEEIKVGFEILKGLGLRHRGVNLIACPSCARQKFNVIQIVNELEERLAHIQESIDVAVIGCVVNGPGEAKEAQLGVTGGYPVHMMYQDGEKSGKLRSDNMLEQLVEQVEARAKVIRAQKEAEQ